MSFDYAPPKYAQVVAEIQRRISEGEYAPGTLLPSEHQLVEAFGRYRELGGGDLSVVLGHDDASAMRTLEVLLSDVLPAMAG